MALKLMYITNSPEIAKIAEENGVDRIFVDMEYIGKADRQGGMNSVQNHHTLVDVRNIRSALTTAQLLVRVNPIHAAGTYLGVEHTSSEEEINGAIDAGADILMLPYFKTPEEVAEIVRIAAGRAKVIPLLETAEAAERIDEIAAVPGIDSIHIGINDLCLSQGKTFMFELLADGTVETLCNRMRKAGVPYGFGGIGMPGSGLLPAEYIIREHYRLGSTCAILSRSFCDTAKIKGVPQIRETFGKGTALVREVEAEAANATAEQLDENHKQVQHCVERIINQIQEKKLSK